MEKYKNENGTLIKKIKELEETILSNNAKYQQQKKEILVIQSQLKKENFEYNSQIIDLQNKIGNFYSFCEFLLFLFRGNAEP